MLSSRFKRCHACLYLESSCGCMDGLTASILSKYRKRALNSRSAAVMDARLGKVPGSGIKASCENTVSPAADAKKNVSCSVHVKDG